MRSVLIIGAGYLTGRIAHAMVEGGISGLIVVDQDDTTRQMEERIFPTEELVIPTPEKSIYSNIRLSKHINTISQYHNTLSIPSRPHKNIRAFIPRSALRI